MAEASSSCATSVAGLSSVVEGESLPGPSLLHYAGITQGEGRLHVADRGQQGVAVSIPSMLPFLNECQCSLDFQEYFENYR